jgi:ATP-dependent DNA helicase RecQ
MNDSPQIDWLEVRAALKDIWGYDDFRSPQAEIIQSLLASRDALIIMPTGGGKSICFQLPALFKSGLTLVISPLVALIENQVQQLRQLKLPAALLHGEIPREQRKQTLAAIEKQRLRLLYLSPETLLSSPVWQRIASPEIKINGLILDEAHCLVQWGDTFRPAYRRLGAVRPALLQTKPSGTKISIAAFTATANPSAQEIITKTLQLENPQKFLISPYRPNLNLKVQQIWTPRCRRDRMLKFIQARGKQSGLVYVRSRRDSEELARWFESLQYNSAAYHAGLSPDRRREIEANWLQGKTQFVACTSAFGMGIDKPDVRWVVHFHIPQLLSEYIQEVGRGGRDGKPTDALTLISEPTGWFNAEDRQQNQFFAQKLQKQYQQAYQIAKHIPLQGNIETITREFKGGDLALSLLHSAGKLDWKDTFSYQRSYSIDSGDFERLSAAQSHWHKEMKQYLATKNCRWQFLLNAFGFQQEASGFRCGHCDNCCKYI